MTSDYSTWKRLAVIASGTSLKELLEEEDSYLLSDWNNILY